MFREKLLPTLVATVAALSFSAHASLISNGSFEQTPGSADCLVQYTHAPYASCDAEVIRTADGNSGGWGVFNQLPGWNLLYGNGIEIQGQNAVGGGFAPAHGDFYVDLDSHFEVANPTGSNAGIYQQLNGLAIGQWYELTFAYGIRTNNENENGLNVFWGEDEASLADSIVLSMIEQSEDAQWFSVSYMLQATSDTMFIGFGAFGDYVRQLDNGNWTSDGSGRGAMLDNVSLVAVPAPATLGLFGLALAGLLLGRRR
ncbi:PEP-CTERM sorting domain-containing protein [Alkalimonas sp. NCh-2]|uniref:PEP-CTERM sorting domain-containing protein n=1 Tax=Alkalimonas sp. NCh-2 TaxID=3144846 RepID=UPI0031F6B6E0